MIKTLTATQNISDFTFNTTLSSVGVDVIIEASFHSWCEWAFTPKDSRTQGPVYAFKIEYVLVYMIDVKGHFLIYTILYLQKEMHLLLYIWLVCLMFNGIMKEKLFCH